MCRPLSSAPAAPPATLLLLLPCRSWQQKVATAAPAAKSMSPSSKRVRLVLSADLYTFLRP